MWISEAFLCRCTKQWFFQTTDLTNYEGICLLPSQKLQHRQVPASLFCRSLNNVHKGCILVNKLLHIQYSFLPACVEKETARVRSNMPFLLIAFSSFWYCSPFFVIVLLSLILLKNSIRAHRWVSPEHDRHYRQTPHLVLRLVAEYGKPGARSLFLVNLFKCLDFFALFR